MPYKDPDSKKTWERQHRAERCARRRELHQPRAAAETTQNQARSNNARVPIGYLWLPAIAGGALATYNPPLGVAAGAIAVIVAATQKLDWRWWFPGLLTIAVALFFLWNDQNEKKRNK